MKFDRETMENVCYNGGHDGFEVLSDEQVDSSRWESINHCVFEFDGKIYLVEYRIGLTECQETDLFSHHGEMVEAAEVEAYEEVVTKYRVK